VATNAKLANDLVMVGISRQYTRLWSYTAEGRASLARSPTGGGRAGWTGGKSAATVPCAASGSSCATNPKASSTWLTPLG
jgi:hypothetical protein